MIINITASICFIITVIILTYDFFSKEKIDKLENKYFKVLAPLTLIGLIMELILYSLTSLGKDANTILVDSLTRAIFMYYVVFMYIYVLYTFSTCWNITDIHNKKYIAIRNVLTILYAIFLIVVTFLPYDIVEKKDYFYPSGLCMDFSYLIGAVGLGFITFSYFKNIKKLPIKKNIPILGSLIFALLSVLLQFKFPQLLLLIPAHAITITMLYFSIENPDIKMLEEVSLAKEQAEKANTAKSEFLSNMSHEIRTPLNAIVGFSEMLKEDKISKEAKEKVEDIITASQNLLEIVNGILDISKIEANKLEIIKKEYDPNEMLQELISLTKARIGDKGLDFKINIDQTIPSVLYGDDARIKQIILNILTNAVKYTKEGYVIFTVSSIIKDNVCRLIISVEDSGIGIKQENLKKLFTKFERLEVEKQFTIEGTGLGLAITKKLLDLMNGTIIVQSVYGKGSKFTISLDQRIVSTDVPLDKKPAKVESTIIDANGAKVLIVDDNEMNIKVATTLLKKYHFNIDSCSSGRSCIAKIKENNNYDLILLDDMMPKLSGKETLLELKKIPNFNIPVIALTANAITGMKEEYINFGFNDYLSKPIERKDLERIIKTVIKKDNQKQINSSTSISTTSIITEKLNKKEPNILVIDENIYTCKILESALSDFEVKVSNTTTTKEAITNILEKDYTLVFVDKELKDKSYQEVIKELQSIEGFNSPVILMTKDIEEQKEIDEIKKIGYSGYITKPIDNIEIEKIYKTIVK